MLFFITQLMLLALLVVATYHETENVRVFKDWATPPLNLVCTVKQLYCDTTTNKKDCGRLTFNSAFVVSDPRKNEDGTFNVVMRYEADHSDKLYEYFAENVALISVAGTGSEDVYIYRKDRFKGIESPFRWSKQIQVKPQIRQGKCCLPDTVLIGYTFANYGPGWSALNCKFGKSCVYRMKPNFKFVETCDAESFFNKQWSKFKRDDELADLEKRTNKYESLLYSNIGKHCV